MKHLIGLSTVIFFLGCNVTFAAEKTVNLTVKGMTCAACPYMVKSALKKVDGVTQIEVSLAEKRAVVTYDDTKTQVEALTDATLEAGFPSALEAHKKSTKKSNE